MNPAYDTANDLMRVIEQAHRSTFTAFRPPGQDTPEGEAYRNALETCTFVLDGPRSIVASALDTPQTREDIGRHLTSVLDYAAGVLGVQGAQTLEESPVKYVLTW